MKKFGLILICSVIMTVFIAFNYLLWDRERNLKSLENMNSVKNASLDTLSREYDTNSKLRNRVSDLEEFNKQLQTRISQLEVERQKQGTVFWQASQNIYALKRQADLSSLEAVIRFWADEVDKGRYENAYAVLEKTSGYENLNEFANTFKNNVKSIKIKSIKLLSDDLPDARKGELLYQVVFDIKKLDNAPASPYLDGENTRFFLMGYNMDKKNWGILNIASTY